jgi:hypothetical protein
MVVVCEIMGADATCIRWHTVDHPCGGCVLNFDDNLFLRLGECCQ